MDLKPVLIFGGLPSVGSSSLAKRVAGSLNLEYIYVGKIFREMCVEDGHCPDIDSNSPEFEAHLSEYVNNIIKDNNEIDMRVDAKILNKIKTSSKPILVEGRVISALTTLQNIPVVLRVWVNASVESRIQRFKQKFSKLENVWDDEKIKRTLLTRDNADRQRYMKVYGIDIYKPEKYNDLIFDNSFDSVDKAYMALTTDDIFKNHIKKLFDFYPTYDVVYRWKCLVCGYTYEGFKPVRICPNCGNIDPAKFQDL